MLGIRIRDQFISLFDGTVLTFDVASPIGLTVEDIDKISGGYTFPIDIPLDAVTVGVIGHIGQLDGDGILLQDEYCEVWAEGLLLHVGKASIKTSGRTRARLFIILNEATDLAPIKLIDVDLEGLRAIGADSAARTAHALATATDPLDHDYVFAPLFNPKFFETALDPPTGDKSRFQNFFDTGTGAFIEDDEIVPAAMPFVRIDYLLRRIFREQGYTLDNQWQIDDELKLLLLYNNYSIFNTAGDWSSDILLSNHVPDVKAIDLAKSVFFLFALGLFYDPFDRNVLLIPWSTLIDRPEYADWTAMAEFDFDYDTDRSYPRQMKYAVDQADHQSASWITPINETHIVDGSGVHARLMYLAGEFGVRLAYTDNAYWFLESGLPGQHLGQYWKPMPVVPPAGASDKDFLSTLIPAYMSWRTHIDGSDTGNGFTQLLTASIWHRGKHVMFENVDQPLESMRIMFYRGFQKSDTVSEVTYPMLGITPYDAQGSVIGAYALQWDGEYGIYERFWKKPHQMLQNKKRVVRRLNLSISDLINFRFYHKIRIENQNYFITRLRYSISNRGLGISQAEMINTI